MNQQPTTIESTEDFQAVCDRIANLQVHRERLKADEHAEIEAVQERYAPEVESVDTELKEAMATAQKYAKKHRAKLFPGRLKSLVTSLAEAGFRLGKVFVQVNKGVKWDAVAEELETLGRNDLVTVKRTVTVDKDRLANEPDAFLERLGLVKKQRENFFVDSRAIKARDGGKEAA